MASWREVPGFFDFQDIYDEVVRMAPRGATLVEVGTLFGRSAIYLAQRMQEWKRTDLRFCVVDRWELWPDVIWHPTTAYSAELRLRGGLFEAFNYWVDACGVRPLIQAIRMDSAKAAETFCSIFFVFIDGDHSRKGATADILAWREAQRRQAVPGAYMAGHDYKTWPDVSKVVHEIFPRVEVWPPDSWLVRGVAV